MLLKLCYRVSFATLLLFVALNARTLFAVSGSNLSSIKVLQGFAERTPYQVFSCQRENDDHGQTSQLGYERQSHVKAVAVALSGDCQQAKGILVNMVEQQPKNRLAWLVLGDVYFALGEPQQAQFAWRQAKGDVVLAGRGRYAETTGDTINAELWLVQASQVEDGPEATLDLVDLYLHQGRKAEAKQLLQVWIQRTDEDQVAHWFAAGMLAELDDRGAEAVTAYRRMLALNPDDYDLLVRAKAAMERQQDWEGAIAVTLRLLDLVPEPHNKWWMLEIALYESYLGNYREAIAWARKAQRNYQGPAWEPLYYLGRVACVEGDLPSAKDYFEEGLRLSPENWKLLYQLGMCIYSLSGDDVTARAYLERAAKQDKGQAGIEEMYLWLAELYVRSGEVERAIPVLKRVLALDPGNVNARERLDALRDKP